MQKQSNLSDHLEDLKAKIALLPESWALTPVGDNKAPLGNEWEQRPFTRDELLTELALKTFSKVTLKSRTTNEPFNVPTSWCRAVGLLCGELSGGLLLFDHDGASGDDLIKKLSGVSLIDALPATPAVTSQRPGRYQLVYQVPAMYWQGIQTVKIKTGVNGDDGKPEQLEFRWNKTQSVVDGYHPVTGGYIWKHHPSDVEVAIAPQWMITQMLIPNRTQKPDYPQAELSSTQWALSFLAAIHPTNDYEEWLSVGMALHSVDSSLCNEWDKWSSGATNYEPEQCDRKWSSFKRSGSGIGTLGYLAKKNGWTAPEQEIGHSNGAIARTTTNVKSKATPDNVTSLREAVEKLKNTEDIFTRTLLEGEISKEFNVRADKLNRLVDFKPESQIEVCSMADLVMGVYNDVEKRHENPNPTGVLSGFNDLDNITGGWQKQNLIIVAGRPSMGKTAAALNFAVNAAKNDKKVALFSLEMDKESLGARMLSAEAKINSDGFRTGNISINSWEPLGHATARLSILPISIFDPNVRSLQSIVRESRALHGDAGLDLIIIDYLQFMDIDSSANPNYEIGRITKGLKQLAQELKIPVICLSQLSRAVEGRADKRPMMSDLRDSGSIEQDADLIVLLYRDEYYNKQTTAQGIAEFIISKHRNGAVGTVELLFEPQYNRFSNISKHPQQINKKKAA